MTTATQPTAAPPAAPGRLLVRLGIALAVLPFIAFAAQMGLKVLRVPWYVPVLGTVAALCFAAAVGQRRGAGRVVGLVLVGLLAAVEWYFVLVLTALPAYTGPVAADKPFPAFQTSRADGKPFTQADLGGDRATVLTFFRGRW